MRLLLLLSCLVVMLGTSGCLFHKKEEPKNVSHMYGGNAPSIHFTEEHEHAGGELHTY